MVSDFTLRHLARWVDRSVRDDEREQVITDILSLLARRPEVIHNLPWKSIRHMAEVEAGRDNPFY